MLTQYLPPNNHVNVMVEKHLFILCCTQVCFCYECMQSVYTNVLMIL